MNAPRYPPAISAQDRLEIDVARTKLAKSAAIEAFQMHVANERLHFAKSVHRSGTCVLEVDRVEIQPHVGAVDGIQDPAADVGPRRRPIMVLEHELHLRMRVGHPPQVAGDDGQRVRVERVDRQASEEQAEAVHAKMTRERDLPLDRFQRRADRWLRVEEVAPSA